MDKTQGTWIGQVLSGGRYRVEELLGAGGMGFIYRAVDRNIDANVVVKVPRPEMLQDPDFSFRFKKELQALVRLPHAHIVKISDAGEHQGLPFGVMQYLPGGSLEDRIEPGPDGGSVPHPAESLAAWMPDIARALDYMHVRGYVHRDIKPGNILFDESGSAILSDFGIAKAIATAGPGGRTATMTSAGGIVGTLEYMARELILGQDYDGRADQYALAVTAYEILAGRRPFREQGPTLIFRIGNGEAPPALHDLASVPERLSRVIHRAMHPDQAERFPNCVAFASAVAAEVQAARPATHAGVVALRCPACDARMAATESMRGRRGRCSACQARFRVADDLSALELVDDPAGQPAPDGVAPGITIDEAPPARPRTTKRQQPASTTTLPPATPEEAEHAASRRRAWVAPGAAAGVAALGAVAWFALQPAGRPEAPPTPAVAQAGATPRVPPPVPSVPPVQLERIPPQNVTQGERLVVQVRPRPSVPAPGMLEFSLVGDPPSGAEIGRTDGKLAWATGPDQPPGTHRFVVEARPAGQPGRSARAAFEVQVRESRSNLLARTAPPSPPPGLPEGTERGRSDGEGADPEMANRSEPPAPAGPQAPAARTDPNPERPAPAANPFLDRLIAGVKNKKAAGSLAAARQMMGTPDSFATISGHLAEAANSAKGDPGVERCIKEIRKATEDERLDGWIAGIKDDQVGDSLKTARVNMRSSGGFRSVTNSLEKAAKIGAGDPDVERCIQEIRRIADDVRRRSL